MTRTGSQPELLIHACCGPCLLGPLVLSPPAGYRLTAHFYNPNIHPLIEFRRRLKALKVLQESEPVEVICEQQYGLAEWLEAVDWRSPDRCAQCYRLRLTRTAALARERGAAGFTTSLLLSPHQSQETIRRVGEAVAAEANVPFHFKDYRPCHDESRKLAKSKGLYLQSYCGCIFSEQERYKNTRLHLYKGNR